MHGVLHGSMSAQPAVASKYRIWHPACPATQHVVAGNGGGPQMSAKRRMERIEPTHEWQELLPLFTWPEQVEYERIRQPVLFGSSVAERAEQTGVSERTLRRRMESFEAEGMQVLAERVALMSWRLNRVVLYEAERLQEGQEDVIEDLRQERLHKGRIEAIYKGQDPDALGVLIEAHPANVLDDLEMARALYKHVCHLFDESKSGVRIEGGYGGSLLDLAAREAVKIADYHAGVEDADEREVRNRAEKLQDTLPGIPDDAYLDDMEFTVGQLKSLVERLAREAGIPPETGTVDDSVISPEEQLLEIVHIEARYEVVRLKGAAEKVQAQILKKRRERVLPDQADLQTVSRYEAHLSRQMYQALHELEALQTRRGGKAAPLARLDVQS